MAQASRPAGSGRPFLNTQEAGFYLGLSARHLERMRAAGNGPVYRRHGRFVVYHITDLDAWSLSTRTGHVKEAGGGLA